MIIDGRQGFAAGTAEYDVCIVGAGVAGISLALELEGSGLRVCLLEAGGRGYERRVQDLFHGEVDAVSYPPLRDTRLAALGGTSGVWAGWCRPLEVPDFENRPDAVDSEWPFGLAALWPYYERAHPICGLGPCDYAPEAWRAELGAEKLFADDANFVDRLFFVNARHFGERYLGDLQRSKQTDVVLHASVVRLVADRGGCTQDEGSGGYARVSAAEVRDDTGHGFTLRAARFVLAAGGIENPRLLLMSADSPDAAVSDESGLVGRYFTDHAFVDFGSLVLDTPASMRFYLPAPVLAEASRDTSVRGVISLRDDAVRQSGLLNAALFVYPQYETHWSYEADAVKALLQLHAKFARRAVPGNLRPYLARAVRAPHAVAVAMARRFLVRNENAHRWRMRAMYESEPRYENRVTLSSERDKLGRPKAKVAWRLGDRDIASMRRVTALFDERLREAGIGRLERAFADEPDAWRAAAEGGKHHMGTTRMHRDPGLGVVDENCRVHGTSNLFIAGSSVFPSCGYANPTLTIVALAIRLADHLKQEAAG